jgi:hypothetical protein
MTTVVKQNKARDYKRTTLRRLDTLSGNLCTKPGCTKQFIGEDEKTIISKICHIEAAEAGGARYNSDMTDDQRRDYDNLILLCDEHHSIIDNKENEGVYTVEILKRWKIDREQESIQKKLGENPSLLGEMVNAISEINFDKDVFLPAKPTKFKPQDKIDYNNVVRFKPVINAYKVYCGKIDKIYQEIDKQGSNKKKRLLRNIELIYLKIKGKYTVGDDTDIIKIREQSDNIMDEIETELISRISNNRQVNHYEEDRNFAVMLIMVDAFIRCKILEKPLSK